MSDPLETTLGTCSVCGDPTKWACVDCRDDIAATVHVCGYSPRCRKAHEEKCTTKLRGEIASLRKQLSESEVRVQSWQRTNDANMHSVSVLNAEVATLKQALADLSQPPDVDEWKALVALAGADGGDRPLRINRITAEYNRVRQALEAAKGVLRSADEVFDSTWAANWDKHYGKGLSVEYAQAISIQLTNLRQRFKVALAQIESLTPSAEGEPQP